MLILLNCLTLLLALLTLAPLSRKPQWWIRGLDFPRLQLLALATALTALYLISLLVGEGHTRGLLTGLAISLCCALEHGRRLIPYSRFAHPELESCPENGEQPLLRIMIANVLMSNRQYSKLVALISAQEPDLVLFLESDKAWEAALDTGLQRYPHTARCALDNLYGMHLYSRLPLSNTQVRYRVQPGVPSIVTDLHWPSGETILLHCLHPAPPSPTENEKSTERDAELVRLAGDIGKREGPTLVLGDFNDVPWSRATRLFRKLSGLADPRVGRGLFSTFHAGIPLCRWPLDHLFCSEHFSLAGIERSTAFGSDHFALIVRLAITRGKNGAAGSLGTEAGDEQEAEKIIEEIDERNVDAV